MAKNIGKIKIKHIYFPDIFSGEKYAAIANTIKINKPIKSKVFTQRYLLNEEHMIDE